MSNQHYRNICKYNEEYMQPILDNLYRMLDIQTERVYDKSRQTKGADVIFYHDNEKMALDEKVSTSKQLYVPDGNSFEETSKESRDSYGMELSTLNKNGDRVHGWFHPAERSKSINSGYMIAWVNTEKNREDGPDQGKLRKVNQLEICIVPYDKLLAIVDMALEGIHIDEKVARICASVEREGAQNEKRVFKDCPLANKGVRFSYSGQLEGKPINCMIPKNMLREISFINYAFNFRGELGRELVESFRNLKDNKECHFRPIKELRQDIKEFPTGFPKPHYASLDDKKERIFAQMGLPAKAFFAFVSHQYIKSNSIDFIRYSETAEQALRRMISHCVDETGMVKSKYYPIVMGYTPEKCDDLSTNEKRSLLVDEILKDHDKLSELYTIKALENWRYEPDMILKATCVILPNNLTGLEERINKTANYIERQQQKDIKPFKPKRGDDVQKDFERSGPNSGDDGPKV